MRLSVRHSTRFDYDTALTYSVQRLHLSPPNFIGQRVVHWKIEAPGIEQALSYIDGFGNLVYLVTFLHHEGSVEVTAAGEVDRDDTAGVVKGLVVQATDAVFLRQTQATTPSPAILEMARSSLQHAGRLDGLHRLMAGIHADVAYEIGSTHAETTAAEAFAAGRGVCQDHTHIFVGAARSLGVPARYVTGYLVTAEGQPATAAHAWAEALVPELGWVGFDPANGVSPTDHYVRVAAGIDATGVTPIRGSRRGGGGERMRVEVSVEIAQQ